MTKRIIRLMAVLMALSLVAAACGSDGGGGGAAGDKTEQTTGGGGAKIDYQSIGLWDDGPCDPKQPPLVIGLMTVFESPVLSLVDQAKALEASAKAFNARGGANGSCLEVHTCDDGGTLDQAVGCVRKLDQAGVVATVNDQGTAGQAEVSAAMAKAGIPRIASNVTNFDWGDPNAYPLDASGTGVTFLLPQALIEADVHDIGIVRVDNPGAGALLGLLKGLYGDQAKFVSDVPVPGGTTDFTQFVLASQNQGAKGIFLALGEQEAVQVVRAAQQLGSKLVVGSSLGSFSHSSVTDLGDFAEQMVFLWSFPPASADLPAYTALRADLAASGEKALQPDNLKASPMRSWIGTYALIKMIRDAGMKDFTREGITQMLQSAKDVPMLDIFGGENWTPNTDHPGLFKRAGTNHWAVYEWDPKAKAPDGMKGNFVEKSSISFDKVLCDSPFGAPC